MSNLQLFEAKEITTNPIIQSAMMAMTEKEQQNIKLSVLDLMANDNLKDVATEDLMLQAIKAAAIGLPISKELGLAYVLPFNTKDKATNTFKKTAALVISVKGIKARLLATGLVLALNSGEVYEGELNNVDRMTGNFDLTGERKSDNIIGFFAYIKLKGGFEKKLFKSSIELEQHALKYSKEFEWVNGRKTDKKKLSTFWVNEPLKMAEKTVVKMLLNSVPILSSNKSIKEVLDDDTEFYQGYDEPIVDRETGEVSYVKETTADTDEDDFPFDDLNDETELEKALNVLLPLADGTKVKIGEYVQQGDKEKQRILKRAKTDKTDEITMACKVYANSLDA